CSSVNDRRAGGAMKSAPERASGAALNHKNRDQLFLRLYPEVDPGAACPTVCALRNGQLRCNGIQHDLHTEAEAHAALRSPELAINHVAGVVCDHKSHRARAEKTQAVEFAAIQKHLGE